MASLSLITALTLLALVVAVLGVTPSPTVPTSSNNPFYEVARHAIKPSELPICCLKPQTSQEPTEEFLSFEEWKAKQAQLHAEAKDGTKQASAIVNVSDAPASEPQVEISQLLANASEQQYQQQYARPRFTVPLTDRFNYASLDCSARVHASHRSAKSPYSILSSKKDKYMLSPCSPAGEQKFIVVELCDDIRIDTVQLANFEFFSGVFKDFSVSVAKTFTNDPADWTSAGTYRAKNIRGIQSFHPPNTLRDFYRYIRIDFLSHYGNEYYCPVSLLRVYGLTHMEEWKLDVWEAEYRAKHSGAEELSTATISATTDVVEQHETESPHEETAGESSSSSSASEVTARVHVSKGAEETIGHDTSSTPSPSERETPSDDLLRAKASPPNEDPSDRSSTSDPPQVSTHETATSARTLHPPTANVAQSSQKESVVTSSKLPPTSFAAKGTTTTTLSTSPQNLYSSVSRNTSTSITHISSMGRVTTTTSHSEGVSHTTGSSSSPIPTVVPHPAVPMISPGESIFRTIMTRLSILEANSTLYARYVEEQTRSMREALRRLEEDVGRIEGIGKAQAQFFQKSMQEWERQRKRLEREHFELLDRLEYLTDEITLEKRLGIAQLSLLLIVLVFIALTRGSRGESITIAASGRRDSLRAWGRRQLSGLSGEWTSKFRSRSASSASDSGNRSKERDERKGRSRSQTPTPAELALRTASQSRSADGRIVFPSQTPQHHAHTPHRSLHTTTRTRTPTSSLRGSSARLIASASARRPVTPTHSASFVSPSTYALLSASTGRPLLRRVQSTATSPVAVVPGVGGGGGGSGSLTLSPVPLSAKRFARTAHLHEIKLGHGRRSAREKEKDKAARGEENNRSERSEAESSDAVGSPRRHLSRERNLASPPKHDRASDAFWLGSPSPAQAQKNASDDPSIPSHQHSPTREPLAPLENSAAQVHVAPLDSPWSPTRSSPIKTVMDGDTESESWVDTDVEGSETGI